MTTRIPPKTIESAVSCHRGGDLDRAQKIYQQVLAASPKDTTALHLLGCLHLQRGQHNQAQQLIAQAIKINPSVATFYNNLGTALRAQGKLNTAVSNYQKAVKLNPQYSEAHYNLGIALYDQRRFKQAEASFRKGLKVHPTHLGMWNNLGQAFQEQGKLAEAESSYREALRIKPDLAEAMANLAGVLQRQGRLDEAVNTFHNALDTQPDLPGLHQHMGDALFATGKLDEAIEAYRQHIRRHPIDALGHNALAKALRVQGKLDESIDSYRRVVQLCPGNPEAHLTLADALRDRGELAQAAIGYREAIRLKPNHAIAVNNLGYALAMQGHIEEAIGCFKNALRIKPRFALAQSNLAFFMNYMPGATAEAVAGQYRRWAKKHTRQPQQARSYNNTRDPDRRLRIGYLSPAFRAHPVGRFFDAFLGHHNPSAVEVFCYAQVGTPDQVTERLRSYAHHWRSTVGKPDTDVQQMIRDDGIDIIINAATHTAGHRLGVLAGKPAPVQAVWMGGPPVTTGMETVDHLITDSYQSPPGLDHLFTEKLLRLPDGYICYEPPSDAPPVTEPPLLKNGYVTFGCFNALCKINTRVIDLWAGILQKIPTARLALKTHALKEQQVCDQLLGRFAAHGVAADRIALHPASPHSELLAFYGQVDITLDPFPYSGGISTLESLWMGVPVVTLNAHGHAVRHSVSHLSNTGLQELIAKTPQQYAQTAAALADDKDKLVTLRATLRDRMSASPLCDAKRFTANLELAYRRMWQQWCKA